jgi:uncharacterized damage-inducible protein DinB
MKKGIATLIIGSVCVLLAQAAEGPSSLIADSRASYDLVSRYVLASAEKMPEENYGFRPTPDVRTFAQLLGHIADAQYIGCSAVAGEKYTPRDIEKNKSTKADLVPALKQAFAYCESAWSKMTDATAADRVDLFGRPRSKLAALDLGTAHAFEHYGNMVNYMRMKQVVPASSEK